MIKLHNQNKLQKECTKEEQKIVESNNYFLRYLLLEKQRNIEQQLYHEEISKLIQQPIMHFNVSLENNKIKKIAIYQQIKTRKMAEKFVKDYNLDPNLINQLQLVIQFFLRYFTLFFHLHLIKGECHIIERIISQTNNYHSKCNLAFGRTSYLFENIFFFIIPYYLWLCIYNIQFFVIQRSMDYDDLFRLLPKPPKKWSTQEVLVWLKYIGYSQLDTYFVNECVDGSCLEILTDQDLLDIGVTSALQRKKLLQWIQIGLKEFTNYCKSHIVLMNQNFNQLKIIIYKFFIPSNQLKLINLELEVKYYKKTNYIDNIKNEVTPQLVQTFMEVQQISSPRVDIPQQERIPLKVIQDRILQSRHEYDIEIEEKIILGQIPIEPLPSPGGRQKQQFILPVPKSHQKITEEDLARQVQQCNKKNIFAELQMQQIQKPIILSPQKQQQLQESDYHLPQFGTPRFDKQEKRDNQEIQQNNQQQLSQIQSPKTQNYQLNIKIKKEGLPTQKKLITKNATIGRNPENDIQLQQLYIILSINHESVSRTHVWLTFKEKQFYLQDRGSLIGTFILLETKTQIMQGYIIQMGATEIVIQSLQKIGQQCNIVLASQMGSVQFTLSTGKSKMIGSQTFGDQTMAYDHALLEFTSEGLSIEDQKTSSGTWMRLSKSGVQSQSVPLCRRRVIKIADYILIMEPE